MAGTSVYSRSGPPGSQRPLSSGRLDAAPDAQGPHARCSRRTSRHDVRPAAAAARRRASVPAARAVRSSRNPSTRVRGSITGEPRPIAENVFSVAIRRRLVMPVLQASRGDSGLSHRHAADRLARQLAGIGRDGQTQRDFRRAGPAPQPGEAPPDAATRAVTSRTELETRQFRRPLDSPTSPRKRTRSSPSAAEPRRSAGVVARWAPHRLGRPRERRECAVPQAGRR